MSRSSQFLGTIHLLLTLAAAGVLSLGCAGAATMAERGSGPDSGAPLTDKSACEVDLGLTAAECEQVEKLELPATLKPSAGNRFADNDEAARLGFLIFYDQGFSTIPDVRCATCHVPEAAFGDDKALAEVIPGRPAARNSPSILNAAWAGDFYFWDGRADSLWSQPLLAFENPDEMAGTRLAIAHRIFDQPLYRASYETLFGPLPNLDDSQRFPLHGKPGDAAFDQMAESDRMAINLVVANVGKALEAYMRKLATGPSALDEYLAGHSNALEPAARSGLSVFVRAGCISCHSGPALSDGGFHNVGESGADTGRAGGLAILKAAEFNAASAFFDQGVGTAPAVPGDATGQDVGAFRTPTLRNLPRTAPYWHDGRFTNLDALLDSPHGAQLSPDQRSDLKVFLLSLNGAYPSRPWSDWPAR